MNFTIDIINALVILAALANMVYGLVVYSRNRKDATNFWFFVLTLAVSAWGVGMFLYRGFGEINAVVFSARVLYVAAASIPLAFLYFIFVFPNQKSAFTDQQKYLLPLPFFAIVALSLWPNGLIETVQFIPNAENIIIFNLNYHLLYALYIIGYFSAGYLLLFRRLKTADSLYRQQILYILSGTLIATLIGVATNLVLPLVGIFTLNWFGQVGTVVMIGAISYAILKHHLFNVRVITTEIFVAALWIFAFIRFFLSTAPQDKLADSIMLFVSIVLGLLLAHSVQKEVEHAEQIEKLSEEKSEFMSFATHQVKRPLSAFKSASSMLLQGDYGPLSSGVRTVVQELYQAANEAVPMVQAFLDSSKLEQEGGMTYQMEQCDLREIAAQVANEEKFAAEEKGLTLSFEAEGDTLFTVHGDALKLKQVFYNLVDNAIKYTEKGGIAITLKKSEGKITFSVRDTGRGIPQEEMQKLFKKFSRADGAQKINVSSNGLGLYLASEFVKAHSGRIWAESAGAGKGTTFFVEVPVN